MFVLKIEKNTKNLFLGLFLFTIMSCSISNTSNLTVECKKGDMSACNDLATQKFKNKKTDEAMNLFKLACDGGNLNSCTNLGILEYKKGNTKYAKEIFSAACEKGSKDSCNNIKRIDIAIKNVKK